MRNIIIGTRESKLAVTQAKSVKQSLEKIDETLNITLKYVSTKGDKKLDVSLSEVGGKGIFSTDIEYLLEQKEIDFAVHSLKDLPVNSDERFVIAATPEREDARDALISRNNIKLNDLKEGAIIGTSSPRRQAQLKAIRPDLKTDWIRGPIDSRIKQLEDGNYDAIILAVAGINRLNLNNEIITEYLPLSTFVPAFGQGALAIQCRKGDIELYNYLRKLNDERTEIATTTERILMRLLDEEDKAPIGVYADVDEGNLITLHSSVASVDGETILFEQGTGNDPLELATKIAEKLKARGAEKLIEEAKKEL